MYFLFVFNLFMYIVFYCLCLFLVPMFLLFITMLGDQGLRPRSAADVPRRALHHPAQVCITIVDTIRHHILQLHTNDAY
jgi:hypothetical protein